MKCSYCYYSDFNNKASLEQEVSLERLKEVIDQAKELGCERVILSGGEPMMSAKFPPLLDYCVKRDLSITIITNGTKMTDARLEQLLSLRDNIWEIKVSYDGPENDVVRGHGAGKETLHTINRFDEHRLPWTLNTVLTRHTWEELPRIYQWLKTMHPKAWRMDLPFSSGSYIPNRESLDVPNLEELFKRLSSLLGRYLDESPEFELWMFTIYRPGLENALVREKPRNIHPCTYNKRNLAIRGNGEVTPCSRFLHPMGNVKEQHLRDVRSGDGFANFWDLSIDDLNGCQKCDYVHICGGGCRAHSFYEGQTLTGSDSGACSTMPLFKRYIVPHFSDATQESFRRLISMARSTRG